MTTRTDHSRKQQVLIWIGTIAMCLWAIHERSDAQVFAPGNPVTDANPYPVKPAAPMRAVTTTTAGTIAAANAYQTALVASATRRGCAIQNKSGATMRVFIGAPGTATDATAFDLAAGGTFSCGMTGGLVLTDEISIASATAGAAFVVSRQ